jgi:hypothetical protein
LSTYNIIYNGLILIGALLSFMAFKKGHKRFLILAVLLLATTSTELYVQYLIQRKADFTYVYHAFIAIEYPLFCWFLIGAIKPGRFSTAMKISIPVYIIISLFLSWNKYHFTGFPGLNINMEGMLQSIVCTYILFNLEVQEERSILKNQYFWICSGILIFFGTTFFFNGVYSKVLHMGAEKASLLFGIINKPLNLIFYALIIIGILCLPMNRKLTTQ